MTAPVTRALTRKFPADDLFLDIREPLRRALERLSPALPEVHAVWRASLARLVRRRDECDAVEALALDRYQSHLIAGDFEAFAGELERHGQALANRGVAEEHAFLALALYQEHGLTWLAREAPGEPQLAVALARLVAVAQLFLHAGYANARAVGWRALDEQDRQRLARDLHDDIGHSLVLMKLYMEQMAHDFDEGRTPQARRKLGEAAGLVGEAIESVRRVILDIAPAILEQLGLQQAVRLYARQFTAQTGIAVHVQESGLPGRLPHSHETALYRVLQGALANVLKHSKAANVNVTLTARPASEVAMSVEDDGIGFEARRRAPALSFGLNTMRERMDALGGRFVVESWPARGEKGRRGTRIEVTLPLPPGEPA
jgi:signal transduction histidine kinase